MATLDLMQTPSSLDQIATLRKQGQPIADRVRVLASKNLGLAYQYAKRWRSREIPQEELDQQAVVGLLEAIMMWDPAKGSHFSTYALHRMRYQVSRFVEKKWPLVHLPQNVLADRRGVQKARKALERKLGRAPSDDEVRAQLPDLSLARFEVAVQYANKLQFASLEASEIL